MTYVLVGAIAIACAFSMPRRRATAWALLLFGILALAITLGLTTLVFSYTQDQVLGILSLNMDPKLDPVGFLPLVGISYGTIVGAAVAAIRLVSTQSGSN